MIQWQPPEVLELLKGLFDEGRVFDWPEGLAIIKDNALRRGHIGLNPSAYSLIVIRCRISYVAKVVKNIEITKLIGEKFAILNYFLYFWHLISKNLMT